MSAAERQNPGSSQNAPKKLAFARLPHGLMADRRLHPIDKVVAAAILHHAWRQDDVCTASTTTLGQYAGCSRDTAQRSVDNLEAHGYFRRNPCGGKVGRSIVAAWNDDPSVIPAPPPLEYKARDASPHLKLVGKRAPRRCRKGIVDAAGREDVKDASMVSCSTGADNVVAPVRQLPVAPVRQLPVAPVRHKEEGLEEAFEDLEESFPVPAPVPLCGSQRTALPGRRKWAANLPRKASIGKDKKLIVEGRKPADVAAAVKAVAKLVGTLSDDDRLAVGDLVASVGAQIVIKAARKTYRFDSTKPLADPIDYMAGAARGMHAKHGELSTERRRRRNDEFLQEARDLNARPPGYDDDDDDDDLAF